MGQSALVSAKECGQIDDQVADDAQISERLDAEPCTELAGESAAGQLFTPVYHHRTRTTHPHATGKSESEIRKSAALQGKKRIEDSCAFADFNFVLFEAGCAIRFGNKALNAEDNLPHATKR